MLINLDLPWGPTRLSCQRPRTVSADPLFLVGYRFKKVKYSLLENHHIECFYRNQVYPPIKANFETNILIQREAVCLAFYNSSVTIRLMVTGIFCLSIFLARIRISLAE